MGDYILRVSGLGGRARGRSRRAARRPRLSPLHDTIIYGEILSGSTRLFFTKAEFMNPRKFENRRIE